VTRTQQAAPPAEFRKATSGLSRFRLEGVLFHSERLCERPIGSGGMSPLETLSTLLM